MRKLKYVLLLAVSVVLYTACSKQTQITGAAGAAGATGVQGGNLIPIELGPAQLLPTYFKKSPKANYYYYPQRLYNYNKNLSYMITAYVTKQDTGKLNQWYKLPYQELFSTTDEMFCSIGNDSIYLWYYNNGSTPVNAFADTIPTYKIVIIPQQ